MPLEISLCIIYDVKREGEKKEKMDYKKYFADVKAQKQINKLAKKYKNKKIVIYGAGIMAETLFNNYDTSKLNIVAVCDQKYKDINTTFFDYPTISPDALPDIECDVILVLLLHELQIIDFLKDDVLINSQNENVEVKSMIKIPFFQCVKYLLG